MRRSFSLVEILLALAVFALLVTVAVGGLVYGRESAATAGMRNRAVLIAEEGLEAARNIRTDSYASLTNGNHGIAMQSPTPNKWVFSGTSDTVDIFTRVITVSTAGTDRKQVVSTVTWQQTPSRSGTVVLTTYLTNWMPF